MVNFRKFDGSKIIKTGPNNPVDFVSFSCFNIEETVTGHVRQWCFGGGTAGEGSASLRDRNGTFEILSKMNGVTDISTLEDYRDSMKGLQLANPRNRTWVWAQQAEGSLTTIIKLLRSIPTVEEMETFVSTEPVYQENLIQTMENANHAVLEEPIFEPRPTEVFPEQVIPLPGESVAIPLPRGIPDPDRNNGPLLVLLLALTGGA